MPKIKVAKPELEFDCPADDTVLRAALRSGLGFPYECNVGSCGNCLFEIVEGEVIHERADAPAWNERHKSRNRYLGCQARPQGDLAIKVNLRDHYAPKNKPVRTRARLIETEDITHDIREFRLELAVPASFLPGQYALLYVPGVEGARAYSMSNVDSEGGRRWEFQIKKVPGGACTEQLFSSIKTGDEIGFDGPFGMAYLREDAPRDVLCIAGGSGLSPMISIARGFAGAPALSGHQLHFVYGGRRVRDICGEPILRTLTGFGERIHYHPVISEPEDAESAGWTGANGFVHEAAKAMFADRIQNMEIYFAGPPAMAAAAHKMLFESKVPPAQIHFDQFY
ncbi:MAG: 2Fe-2S iron-sulfur cluster-binding protein [Hyphomicrobiaceae bacterium]